MSTRRILVVEDEPDIADLLGSVLKAAGYEVDTAPGADAALNLVRNATYQAAIVDFHLPDMDGLSLHNEIRRLDEQLSSNTLFTSGLLQTDQNLDYYRAFGCGFLCKPFRTDEVLDAINALWETDAALPAVDQPFG